MGVDTSSTELREVLPPSMRMGRRLARLRWDLGTSLALLVGAFFVHDTAYLLRTPYWFDESWVAVSLKVPLTHLTEVSSSSPLGWMLLLRATWGDQGARLVPLVFAGLAAVAAYWLGRELELGRIGAAGLGVVTLFVPAMLERDDLKQYTAEAFVAVLVAAVTVRTHRLGTRRSLGSLVVVVVVALPFANAVLFVGSAALLSLAAEALVRRRRRWLLDLAVAAGVSGLAWGAWLVTFVLPRQSAALTAYWAPYYPPRSLTGLWSYLSVRLGQLAGPAVGLHTTDVLVVLVLLACAALAVLGHAPLAAMPLLAFAELVGAGLLHRYPVLDERTSTWLIVLAVVVVFSGLGRVVTRPWPRLPRSRAVSACGGVALLLVAGGYAYQARDAVRSHPIVAEDTRDQARVVAADHRPGDVVVVDVGADFGYGYYGGAPAPLDVSSDALIANGFRVRYDDPDTVTVPARTAAAARSAYGRALGLAERVPGAHIWLVRAHMSSTERVGWDQALVGADVVRQDPDGLVEIATG